MQPTCLLRPLFLFLGLLLAACGGKPAAADAGQPKDPKATIAAQLEQLKAGDVAALKAGFTERLRERITQEVVDKAKGEAAKQSLDDLVDRVEPGTDGGTRTAKVMMKNGRTLTTLIEVDGRWLADTLWFR